jgi:predicted nucleic acid-binding protein
MEFVIDASVVEEFLIAGPNTQNAIALFRGDLHGDVFLIPELCLNESTNVIWKAVRFRGMPTHQAEQTLTQLRSLPLKRTATKAVLAPALTIGLKHELAIYDSIYIALALRSNNPLVTLDQKQSRVAIAEGVAVKPIMDFGN